MAAAAPHKLAFDVEPSFRRFRLRLARYRYQAEALSELLPEGPSIVLDAGCGKGRFPGYWMRWGSATRHPRVIGMDISWKRMGRAKEKNYGHLVAGDLTRPWPFRDASVDAVLFEQVMEHLTDAQVRFALSEIRRVLRPGGVALIGTPIFTEPELWLSPIWTRVNDLLRRLKGWEPASHLQHLSSGRLWRHIARSGLEPVRVRGYRIFSLYRGLLEDYEWYYRMHQWFGRCTPSLCNEVTVTAIRPRG
jgi:SAM-dependent methyltransferase